MKYKSEYKKTSGDFGAKSVVRSHIYNLCPVMSQ